ncbi:hypothetical protein [Paraburkholderia xenovorans]|uniref:Uncharacterized protein n=1 Tax=Paraburkholderia xenovorans (strain LB400) TaxID=266265 RepID=Q13ZE0_PARXL|nr:hypothetical protein [Paraburkholderia xenovorans]ABE30549.1 hypothetical protein Bxe_A2420 [Paraburkholderia xenovorans LB400]
MRELHPNQELVRVLRRVVDHIVTSAPEAIAYKAYPWWEYLKNVDYRLDERRAHSASDKAKTRAFAEAIDTVVQAIAREDWLPAYEALKIAVMAGPLPGNPGHRPSLPPDDDVLADPAQEERIRKRVEERRRTRASGQSNLTGTTVDSILGRLK